MQANKKLPQIVKSRKKLIVSLVAVVAVILAAVIVFSVFFKPKTDAYKFVTKGIENAEALDDFLLEYSTRQIVTFGDATQDILTAGYLVSFDDMDTVSVEINTESYSSYDSNGNGSASVTLLYENEKVYDISTGTSQEIDISPQEFESIISDFGLYEYSPKNVEEEQLIENEKEELEGSGTVTVSLKAPEKPVLDAYAKEISSLTGESVSAKDLTPVAAFVQYGIYENKVTSQSYTFTVKYTASNGETLKYTVNSDITYVSGFSDEDYDQYIPIE